MKIVLQAEGKTVSLRDLAGMTGMPYQRLYRRYGSGWTGDRIIAWAQKEKEKKEGRNRKDGAKEPVFCEFYTEDELYGLWRRFRGGRHEVELLSDFMGGGRARQARLLIRKFRLRAE